MEKLEQVYESNDLFPLFKNRLLKESRPEYEAYLRWSGFDTDNPPAPLCRMHACWPEEFQPCSGTDFLPIPAGVQERCTA